MSAGSVQFSQFSSRTDSFLRCGAVYLHRNEVLFRNIYNQSGITILSRLSGTSVSQKYQRFVENSNSSYKDAIFFLVRDASAKSRRDVVCLNKFKGTLLQCPANPE